MHCVVGRTETKSEIYKTFKASAGKCGLSLQEWVMNVVSATKVDGPAVGSARLEVINGHTCLVLDSNTAVMTTGHCADSIAMQEMFALGPGDGSKGVHNMKGIGLRLPSAKSAPRS